MAVNLLCSSSTANQGLFSIETFGVKGWSNVRHVTSCDCEEPRLGLNQLNDGTDRRGVPLQDEERSSFGSWFSTFVLRNVPVAVYPRSLRA